MEAAAEFDALRPTLIRVAYRMLGSVVDAEDAVQETMLRAWRALEKFDGRSALGTWLHRIATNVCLDALGDRTPRVLAFDDMPRSTTTDELTTRPRAHWLEPIPDVRAIPSTDDPHERAVMRENLRLAFVSALQALPQVEDVSDFHCVTTWSKYDCRWGGVAFTTLYELAQPKPEAKFVYFTSYDGYSTNLPLSACLDDDVLVATQFDGCGMFYALQLCSANVIAIDAQGLRGQRRPAQTSHQQCERECRQ